MVSDVGDRGERGSRYRKTRPERRQWANEKKNEGYRSDEVKMYFGKEHSREGEVA